MLGIRNKGGMMRIIEKIDRILNEARLSGSDKRILIGYINQPVKVPLEGYGAKKFFKINGKKVVADLTKTSVTFIYDDSFFDLTNALVDIADEQKLKFEPVSMGNKMNFVIVRK